MFQGPALFRRAMIDEPPINQRSPETHFGFRTVPEAEKAGMVHGVFSSVAQRYDLMNDLMSGGVHRLWKDAMIDWLAPRAGMRLLDVAGGTGDIASRFLKRLNGDGHATVCDMTSAMLDEGARRAYKDAI
jgi:demethylmenaquinone methyltransferase/2-methoxy-6-polyprenyl-1,4-benzoquinol methylase